MRKNYYQVKAKIGMEGFEGKIGVVVEFEKNDLDYAELRYLHILTNGECEFIDQVLQGWSEQEQSENVKWTELIRRIKTNNDLLEFMASEAPTNFEFNIDENGFLKAI